MNSYPIEGSFSKIGKMTNTCVIFVYDTCLRHQSFVKVISQEQTPVDVWDHLMNMISIYNVTRFPECVDDQPIFFQDFVDAVAKKRETV